MKSHILSLVRRALGAAALAGAMTAPAHAGLVTGFWDPPFGSFLPGLNYQVRGSFDVPLACSDQANGVYSTSSGPCAGTTFDSVFLRLFNDGADPDNFFGVTGSITEFTSTYFSFCSAASTVPQCNGPRADYFNIASVRIEAGQVVGFLDPFGATAITLYGLGGPLVYSAPTLAQGNNFNLRFSTNGPVLICPQCRQSFDPTQPGGGPFGTENVTASTEQLRQFIVTYISSDASQPKFVDANGTALGAQLDGAGAYLGQSTAIAPVPEPGTLAMAACGALAVAAAVRRRRKPG